MVAGQNISCHKYEIATRWKFEGETQENAKNIVQFFLVRHRNTISGIFNQNQMFFLQFSTKFFLEISFETINTDKDFLSRF